MRWTAKFLLATVGCWMAAEMRPSAAADDVVVEEGADQDTLERILEILSKNLVLGWSDGKLVVDRPATEAAMHGQDFASTRYLVQQTLAKAPKLLVAEAVAQGLPPETAEKLFGGARVVTDGRPEFRDGEVPLSELVETASMKAVEKATANGLIPRDGGMSSSGSGDGHETTIERGPFTLCVRLRKSDVAIEATLQDRSLVFDLRDPSRLTVTLGETGDSEGENGDFVMIKQTAKAFRAKCVRNGEPVLDLDADSFFTCCREHPEEVRARLIPLLRQMGLGPPAMPDDSAVKAGVLARLRRDAGVGKAGGAEEVAPGMIEVRKHQFGQVAVAIDAFRLLDDAGYLEELKQAASPEDAEVIDARLAAIAAGR